MSIPVLPAVAQFRRRYRLNEQPVSFSLNGVPFEGRRGDTVLTAILSVQGKLRHTEFTGEPRAGFCLIGACQDCHVMTNEGGRVRACTTLLEDGMSFVTEPAL
ncbi:(2Fe-2S)-binding protein [Brucella pseudogrignonensis]|uniref:(2Fe-2S)-binding protein n=1 Tax=Brucella pseudogrignonensis TaxID=419475 RepID=UPI0028B52607|nr:(2Fe-2S)-binding protein [Brucella pseudogrignonensis]MDT6940957.1 (2Fe-2S)-binding protein [Brucella pseudogrignonensis]